MITIYFMEVKKLYKWIIIGGGLHGCTVASFLVKRGKAKSEELLIIDPYPEPLYRWKKNTELIGMEFLRSPSVHQIDVDPFSLQKFAQDRYLNRQGFYGPYKRPSLDLFNEHCDAIIDEVKVRDSWHQGMVSSVKKEQGHWKVTTENGEVFIAKNIVISISINQQLNMPHWAGEIKRKAHNQLYHIFDENLGGLESLKPPFVIIGGGITAAHLSIKLTKMYPGHVSLVKRHPFRVHDFDSDPGWLGPKNLRFFHNIKTYEERRSVIKQARHKGSIPKELFFQLSRLEREGKLMIENGEVQTTIINQENQITLTLENQELTAETLLLATGFLPILPGGHWLNELIEKLQLKCAGCGYPIINEGMEWCSHLYVSGPLAELEIGPVARNISGARMAAERIVSNL